MAGRLVALSGLLVRLRARMDGLVRALGLDQAARFVLLGVAAWHVVGIGWGLPASDGWDVDGVAPHDFLPGLLKAFTPGEYFTYPPLHLLVLAVLTLPVSVVTLMRCPSLSRHDVVQTFLHVPVMTAFALVARVVSLIMFLGVVIAVGRIASAIFGPRARPWAMAISGIEVAGTYYSHTSNLDIPALFWASCALVTLVLAVQRDEPRKLRRVAVLAAFAVGTKDQAYAIFALSLPCAVLCWAVVRHRTGTLRELGREVIYSVCIGGALVLLIDSALFNPTGFLARVRFLSGHASQDFAQYSRDWHGRFAALKDAITFLPRMYPVVMAPIFLLGMVLGAGRARGRERIAALVPLLAILSFTASFNCVARRVEERFMLPQMQLLAVYGGGTIAAMTDMALGAATSPRRRRILAALVSVTAVACILEGIRMSATVIATTLGDARYEAESYLRAHVEPGDRIEVYGVNAYLPRFPSGAAVQRVGRGPISERDPLHGVEEVEGPLGDVDARKPRWIIVSTGYAWRFLQKSFGPIDGHVMPEVQRDSLADVDATNHIRALFGGGTSYRAAHVAHYAGHPLLPPRPLHASLACDMWIFEHR